MWVVYEMHAYQATLDSYNEDCVALHLSWRSSDALQALSDAPGTAERTRAFVGRFLDAQRVLLRDGQMP